MSKPPIRDTMNFLTKREISHDEAKSAAQRLINSHFRNPDHAHVSIPARPDYDDDLVLLAYIAQRRASAPIPDTVTGEMVERALNVFYGWDDGISDETRRDVMSIALHAAMQMKP